MLTGSPVSFESGAEFGLGGLENLRCARIIWNVQCKNNFVDLAHVDSDTVAFARYNRGLVRAYEKALMTEHNRVHLLRRTLGVEPVQHMLVSRFPEVTDNPPIVVFSRIAEPAVRVGSVLAAPEGESAHV